MPTRLSVVSSHLWRQRPIPVAGPTCVRPSAGQLPVTSPASACTTRTASPQLRWGPRWSCLPHCAGRGRAPEAVQPRKHTACTFGAGRLRRLLCGNIRSHRYSLRFFAAIAPASSPVSSSCATGIGNHTTSRGWLFRLTIQQIREKVSAPCRNSAMTVRAPNIALRYLLKNRLKRIGASEHPLHARPFLAAHVIKIQNNRIRLAAIDAWVLEQKFVNSKRLHSPVVALPFRC